MRRANEAIISEKFPLPTFDELLLDLSGCKYFSCIAIKWGYHQIENHNNNHNNRGTFSTSFGYRYNRPNFGIRCASEMF